MDRRSSTGAPGVYSGERKASVSGFLTSIVLLAGVLGGLVIVVTVILVCRYCQGHRKPATRQVLLASRGDNLSDRHLRYDTINSDILSEPSTCSLHRPSLTPRSIQHFSTTWGNPNNNPQGSALELAMLETSLTILNHREMTRIATRESDTDSNIDLACVSSPAVVDVQWKRLHYNGSDHLPCAVMISKGPLNTSYRVKPVFRFPDTAGHLQFTPTETGHLKCDCDPADDYSEASPARAESGPQTEKIEPSSGTPSLRAAQHGGQDGSSRFNEADYHHLRHSKIGRALPRQFSMGGAGSTSQGQALLDHPQFRFSSLDERLPISSSYQPEPGTDGQSNQHQQQTLQQQPQHHDLCRTAVAAERDSLLRHVSRDSQYSDDHFRQSRDKRESPSPNFRLALGAMSFPSAAQCSLREDAWSSPPVRPTPELPPDASPLHFRRVEDNKTSPPSPFRPIKDTDRSAFSLHRPVRTQVSVEVHQHANNRDGSANSSEELHQRLLGRLDRVRNQAEFWSPHIVQQPTRRSVNRAGNSHSLESPRQTYYRDSRKVRSYDDFREDYDVLKITEFSKGPFYNTDYDVISELHSPTSSKVRYNDTGSLEQLNEETSAFACGVEFDVTGIAEGRRELDLSEDSETLNGNRKYRALWRLRTTLEEEEECSDTIRMEDLTSPDESPDREHVTPNTTSFESSVQSEPCPSDHRDSGIQFEISSAKPLSHVNFLHPNYENRRQNNENRRQNFENRRQNYRNVMSDRLKRRHQSTSVENSFDSVDTDGDISDTSRYEMTTTSFESSTTTDNTDSTNESQASKLRQMKADSGYKSLETQQQSSKELGDHEHAKWDLRASVECGEGIASRRDRRTSVERGEAVCHTCGHQGAVGAGLDGSVTSSHPAARRSHGTTSHPKTEPLWKQWPASADFERRGARTASKKRREYSREKHVVQVYESIHEPDPELRTDLHSRDRPEDSFIQNKISVFARFFKSHPRGHRGQYLARDYSIDQKTNSIFNEFVRQELPASVRQATESGRLSGAGLPQMSRHRLQRKHTEPALMSDSRTSVRDRLAPTMRSASLGSESSASSARRISPQDSIEEKDDEIAEETIFLRCLPTRSTDVSLAHAQLQTLSIHQIPLIKFSEQEVPDTS